MQQRRAMSSVFAAWGPVTDRCWDAITSGRYFTWWSVLALLPVALLLLSLGLHTAQDLRQAGAAIALNAVGWVVCCLLLTPAALAERRLRGPTARGVTVLATTLVVAVLRPHLNDLLVTWFTDWPVAGGLPVRTLMSVVVWPVLLIAVAVAVDASDTANHVNRRLRAALAALAGGDASAGLQTREARARVVGVVEDLRRQVAAFRTGVVDFDRVREFSDAVREASHSLDEYADQGLPTGVIRTRPSFFERLRPPPVGLVPIVATFSTLPFTFHLPPGLIVTWAVLVFGVGTACEFVAWLVAHNRSPRGQGRVVVGEAIVAGTSVPLTLLLVAGYAEVTWILPGEVIVVLTLLAAFARGAFDRADAEQRVLTEALGQIRAAGSGAVAPTVEYVHRAADTLHGAVQGRCVVFAATLEDDPATPEQVEEFIESVGARLDLVVAPQTDLTVDPRPAGCAVGAAAAPGSAASGCPLVSPRTGTGSSSPPRSRPTVRRARARSVAAPWAETVPEQRGEVRRDLRRRGELPSRLCCNTGWGVSTTLPGRGPHEDGHRRRRRRWDGGGDAAAAAG